MPDLCCRADKDRLTFLFVNRPDLNKYKLARRHPGEHIAIVFKRLQMALLLGLAFIDQQDCYAYL